jgi:hypothetical protein
MSNYRLQPLDRPDVTPLAISERLRGQLVYFTGRGDEPDAPSLGPDEYFLPAAQVGQVLDDGVFYLVSPLDTANMTEVELSEEQEALLHWLRTHGVQHVRLTST